ncbi:hypothetical protein B1R27_09815 [Streptomyces sp. GKU 895]|nr:hypothetical protein B1R27_09815 [Streptomyces sp. GKU 895]
MSTRGEVFLGDLVKSVALLRPGDRVTSEAIAHLLGFETTVPVVDPPPAPPTARTPPPPVTVAPQHITGPESPPWTRPAPADAAPPLRSALPEHPDLAPRLAERPLDFALSRISQPGEDDEKRAPSEGRPTSSPHYDGSDEGVLPTVPDPPWTPEWARGVMVAVVSAPVASRRLDQRVLMRKVSRQQAMRSVPWQRRPSTRRGVQLLLDHSAGMAPFQDDRRWLRALLESVAGRDRVEVLRFTGSPLRGVVRTAGTAPEVYRPPAPGTPVVLVSDLGRVRPPFTGGASARFDEWLDFIDGVLHAGCPPVCVSPFPARVYPRSVRGRVALIPFDRRISLRHAREATRAVHRLLEERS